MLSPPSWEDQDRRKESNVSAATAFDDRRRESAFDNMRRALSKEGVLTISAPLPQPVKSVTNERLVPIKF